MLMYLHNKTTFLNIYQNNNIIDIISKNNNKNIDNSLYNFYINHMSKDTKNLDYISFWSDEKNKKTIIMIYYLEMSNHLIIFQIIIL